MDHRDQFKIIKKIEKKNRKKNQQLISNDKKKL